MSRPNIDTSVHYDPKNPRPPDASVPDNARGSVPGEEKYDPSPELIEAVDLAIALKRPLLVQGEPGCGKTRLAYAIAYALGLPLFDEVVKSTSRGKDLLYQYDAVARLYDAQFGGPSGGKNKAGAKLKSIAAYITLGALGNAIKLAQYGFRSVVLIDEIDKADIDFPNDLLAELDQMEFECAESPGLSYKAMDSAWPIVVVTHNEEKALPDAFLRRCIYYYIEFPNDGQLKKILEMHGVENKIGERGMKIVKRLREAGLTKKPGVSELIDWAGYRGLVGADQDPNGIPSPNALVKLKQDLEKVKTIAEEMRAEAAPKPADAVVAE